MTRTPRPELLFVSGPPFAAALFDKVRARFGGGEALCVVDAAHPDHGWQERGEALAARLRARPTVLVAHGLAVPAAVAAAAAFPPVALVLANGPVRTLDPFAGALARAAAAPGGAALLAGTVLRTGPWLAWLRSSVGLRRAVVNPYVMDRDTVAALCGPLVDSRAGRRATARYLGSLTGLPDVRGLSAPTLLLWGDGDPLYPASEAAFVEGVVATSKHVSVPGGQHAWPEERPWEMADRVGDWLVSLGIDARA